MSKIVITVLYHNSIEEFIYNLTPEQGDTIFGGDYPFGFRVMNTSDRTYINAVDNSTRYDGGGAGSVNSHDNNINAITSARSINNYLSRGY